MTVDEMWQRWNDEQLASQYIPTRGPDRKLYQEGLAHRITKEQMVEAIQAEQRRALALSDKTESLRLAALWEGRLVQTHKTSAL